MKIKSVLVTGGAGYVGAVLVPKLLHKNYQVKVLDWFVYGDVFADLKKDHLTQIKGDIRNTTHLKQALKNTDAVIHLACISNDPSFELDPKLGKSINYKASKTLADLAKNMGVKRFIFASSSSVYGIKKENQVTEDLSLEPLTDYSKYKAKAEKYLLQKNSDNFAVLVIRPATVCGYSPRLRLDLTVNLLTIQALVNKKITVFGGSQLRPNIHIQDITDLYIKCLTLPKNRISGQIFNAGYENYTIMQIAHMIKKALNNPKIQISTTPTKDLRSYKISSQRIKQKLKFVPKHTVTEAILDLKNAFDKNKIPQALTNDLYYNIRTMKKLGAFYID